MPRFVIHMIASLVMLIPSIANAQAPDADTLRLSVDEAIARAVVASPELARERLEVQRAMAERTSVGAFFPELPELDYRRASDAPFANEGEGAWEIELAQEIELGGQSSLRREAAGLGIEASELRVRAAELDVRADVRETFARLAAAEARVRLFDTLLAFARRLDTAAGRLLAAEEISELERNAVRIERGRSEIELIASAADVAAARSEIATLIRADIGTVVTTGGDALDSTVINAALERSQSVAAALAAGDTNVLASRPDWQALEMARRRASVERQIATRKFIPNVRVGISLESETGTTTHAPNEAGPALATDRMMGFNLGVRIPLPIPGLYDVGQGDVAIADAEIAIAVAEQRVLEARIRRDLGRAAARLHPAAEALALYARQIAPLIARNLELLERGYRAGELSATELITQQRQFAGAAEALIQAELEFNEAYADFERALGR